MSHARSHDWIKSTLGHGETMCRNCSITNREADVLGCLDVCDAAPVPSGQTVIEAASNNFGLTVADLDERREAIARMLYPTTFMGVDEAPPDAHKQRQQSIALGKVDELLASGLVQGEAGWLIEMGDPPVYHCATADHDEQWAPDAGKALRFARREDAQSYSDHVGWTSPPVRIVEHMWPIRSARDGGEG